MEKQLETNPGDRVPSCSLVPRQRVAGGAQQEDTALKRQGGGDCPRGGRRTTTEGEREGGVNPRLGREEVANLVLKERKGRTRNQREGKQPPKVREGGEGREPPSHEEVEGINFNVISFHSKKGNGRAKRSQRTAASPTGGRGMQHHQKEEGTKHHHWKGGEGGSEGGRRRAPLPFGRCCLPSPALDAVVFDLILLGGAAVHLSPFGWWCLLHLSAFSSLLPPVPCLSLPPFGGAAVRFYLNEMK